MLPHRFACFLFYLYLISVGAIEQTLGFETRAFESGLEKDDMTIWPKHPPRFINRDRHQLSSDVMERKRIDNDIKEVVGQFQFFRTHHRSRKIVGSSVTF